MRDHNDLLLQPRENRQQALAIAVVEQGGRLIQYDGARPHGQNADEGGELLLPAAEGMDRAASMGGQIVAVQFRLDAGGDFRRGQAEVLEAEGDVLLQRRHDNLAVRVLEDEADIAAHRLAVAAGRAAEGADGTLSRHNEAVEQAGKSALAGTIRAENADTPLCQPDGDSRQDGAFPEVMRDVFQREHAAIRFPIPRRSAALRQSLADQNCPNQRSKFAIVRQTHVRREILGGFCHWCGHFVCSDQQNGPQKRFSLEFGTKATHGLVIGIATLGLSLFVSIVQKQNKPGDTSPVLEVPNCAACRQRHLSICAAFGEHELVSFDRVVQHKTIPAKTVLFEQGTMADFVFSVSEGTVRLFRLLPDGRRQIIGFAIKGDFLGTAMSDRHEYTAEAVDTIKVCRIPRLAFQSMLDEKPHLLKKLHEIAGREIHTSQDQIVLLGRKNAEERVAAFLLSYRERLARVFTLSVHIPLPMSRQDIADYLGLTIETVSRTISKLARDKLLVVVPDGIRILDLDRLTQLSDG